jgi:hypothetical protein
MANPFFEHPILYSPYEYPTKHWELDSSGQPTQRIIENRRRAEFITPIPKPKKRRGSVDQQQIGFHVREGDTRGYRDGSDAAEGITRRIGTGDEIRGGSE